MWTICIYMEYVYLVYVLGHEVYIKSTPHKFSGFAKVFFFLLSLCYFPETDNPSLVTCSLNKCTFTNSQTRFCISMQALVCVLPMSKQCDSFHIFREATAVSGCQKEERCVPVSTLERDTVLSTFLATAGSKQGMWLSAPLFPCSVQPVWIRGLFIKHKDFHGLKTTSLPDLCMAESPEGNWDAFSLAGELWSFWMPSHYPSLVQALLVW